MAKRFRREPAEHIGKCVHPRGSITWGGFNCWECGYWIPKCEAKAQYQWAKEDTPWWGRNLGKLALVGFIVVSVTIIIGITITR